MKLVILSDTHGFHRGMGQFGNAPVPEGDIIIHCGDYSRDFGSWTDTARFASWMESQPHKYKVVCPGNHDFAVHRSPTKAFSLFREHGVHMIGHHPYKIEGLVFDGGPWMPISGWEPRWGFEMEEGERERFWDRIKEVDVLVSHTPPLGILDATLRGDHLGCPVLRHRVFELKPKIHCFGHVHEARGTHEEQGIKFINASSNTRGTYHRDDASGVTFMMMGIRDALVVDVS